MLDEVVEFYKDGYCFDNELIKPVVIYDNRDNINKDYSDFYEITSFGRVWSVKRGSGKWLNLSKDDKGYLEVCLYDKNTNKKTFLVHRLVLFAFKGPPNSNEECRHLDGNKENANLDNLCWGTREENSLDKFVHGVHIEGINHVNSKLTEKQILDIRKLYKTGSYTLQQIADKYGMSKNNIWNIVNNRSWKHLR